MTITQSFPQELKTNYTIIIIRVQREDGQHQHISGEGSVGRNLQIQPMVLTRTTSRSDSSHIEISDEYYATVLCPDTTAPPPHTASHSQAGIYVDNPMEVSAENYIDGSSVGYTALQALRQSTNYTYPYDYIEFQKVHESAREKTEDLSNGQYEENSTCVHIQ